MAIEQVYGFEAENEDIIFYNQQAVIDLAITYNFDDDSETAYTFPGYLSSFLKIYDERLGYTIKSFTSQVTRNSNVQVINASISDMTFNDVGDYYYELGYVRSGGYPIVLRYGQCTIK